MTPNAAPCRQCDGEMTLHDIDQVEGEEHGVRLRITRMPAMACEKGHRRLVAPSFPGALLDALLAAPPLVPLETAGKRGLLRKRYTCPGCDAVLESASRHVESQRTVTLEGLHPFDVQVDMPIYHCAACEQESLEPRETIVEDLMKASAHAFRAAELAAT